MRVAMRNDVTAVQWAGAVAQTGPAQIFTVPGPRDHEGQKQKEPKKKKKKKSSSRSGTATCHFFKDGGK